MFPFAGTASLYKETSEKDEESEFDDSEWLLDDDKPSTSTIVNPSNGLSLLMGTYCSDSDNEAPAEEKIIYNEEKLLPIEEKKIFTTEENEKVDIKKAKVPLHSRDKNQIKTKPNMLKRKKPINLLRKRRKPTLLEELLKDEIRHERNVLLQCVRYVVNKNFFLDLPLK